MSAINPRVLDDLRALQAGLLAELIDLFLRDADGQVAALRESGAARDVHRFERGALALKGSSGNLGAQAMSRICFDLKTAANGADWARVQELLPGLEVELRSVKAELLVEKARV
jgi:HPt (histidine-containing phosphotransfer) domain-containing protein